MRATRTQAILLAVVTVSGTVAVGSVGAVGASVDLSPDGIQDADDEASDDTATNETEGNRSAGTAFATNLTTFIEALQDRNETGPLGQLIAEFAVSNNPGNSVWNATLNVTRGPPENVTQGPPENATGPPDDNETGPPEDAGPGDGGNGNGGGPPDDAGNGAGGNGNGPGQAALTDRFARTT